MQNRQCDRFMSEILPVTGNNPHLGYNSKKSLANSITIWHEYHRQKKHRPHNKTNFSKKNIKHAIHKDTLSSDFILHILNQALNILNQRSPKYGPRAGSGPPSSSIWPAGLFPKIRAWTKNSNLNEELTIGTHARRNFVKETHQCHVSNCYRCSAS